MNPIRTFLIMACVMINAAMGQVTLNRETVMTDRALYYTEGFFSKLVSIHGNCMDVVNDYIYVAWYEGGMTNRELCLSRKPVGGTTWVHMKLGVFNTLYPESDVVRAGMGDSHRTAAIGICPIDQSIHISFDQHGGNLRYIRSVPGAATAPDAQWFPSLMNPEQKYLVPGSNLLITYPSFTRNDDGGLIFSYRIGGSSRGDRYVSSYNGSVWSVSKLLIKGQSNVAANDFHLYSGISYQYGRPYLAGSVREYSVGYNRGGYFGILPSQNAMGSELLRLDGASIPLPIDNKAELEFLKVVDPVVAANEHVNVFGATVTLRGDIYLTNDEQTYLAKHGETTFSQINNAKGGMHAIGNKLFACSHDNGSVTTYRDKIFSTTSEISAWTEEYAGPQRGYLNEVSMAYKNKIIGLFLDDGPGIDEKTVYCREFDTSEPIPQYAFRGNRQTIPGMVQAEFFDMGGQNVSYSEVTPTRGGDATFRPLESVDVTPTHVGGIDAGEWLEYSVEVTAAGLYDIRLNASSVSSGRTTRLSLDGTVLATFQIPNTGDSNTYQQATANPVSLEAGNHVLRLSTDTGAFQLESIEFVSSPTQATRTVTQNTPGSVIWKCPAGVTSMQVECWGGGGAGGSASKTSTTISAGGGGGAGGAYARTTSVPVTPGNQYLLTVPAVAAAADPATATQGGRVNGLAVTFTGDNGIFVTAAGGQGGESVVISSNTNTSGLGGLGGATGSSGDAILSGGDGAKALDLGRSGAGGGGAGNAADGGDAVDRTAGQGGALGGGTGGAGKSGNGNGNAVLGNGAGGGGGGGRAQTTSGNAYAGANGGSGQLTLTYTTLPGQNQYPISTPVSDRVLIAGQTLAIPAQATDSDLPVQTLTFSLVSPPLGASIDPVSGILTWRPTIAQSSASHSITIMVADNGTPSLSNTVSFQVIVQKPSPPILRVMGFANGTMSLMLSGDSGPDYQVEASGNLKDWDQVWSSGSAAPPYEFSDPEAANHDKRFYRARMGP